MIEGDEAVPVCRNCIRTGRTCQRNAIRFRPYTADGNVVFSARESSTSIDASVVTVSEETAAALPTPLIWILDGDAGFKCDEKHAIAFKTAIRHPAVLRLYSHYVEKLASWYDLTDRRRCFQDVVPSHAMENPLLFCAILAFSAIHLSIIEKSPELQQVATFYHIRCIEQLIPLLTDNHERYREDNLATTCLLRSYEILAGEYSFMPESYFQTITLL